MYQFTSTHQYLFNFNINTFASNYPIVGYKNDTRRLVESASCSENTSSHHCVTCSSVTRVETRSQGVKRVASLKGIVLD